MGSLQKSLKSVNFRLYAHELNITIFEVRRVRVFEVRRVRVFEGRRMRVFEVRKVRGSNSRVFGCTFLQL